MEIKSVRQWAKDQGIEVGKRGRIDRSVKIAYLKAHQHEAREIARSMDIQVPARGRISEAQINKLV